MSGSGSLSRNGPGRRGKRALALAMPCQANHTLSCTHLPVNPANSCSVKCDLPACLPGSARHGDKMDTALSGPETARLLHTGGLELTAQHNQDGGGFHTLISESDQREVCSNFGW